MKAGLHRVPVEPTKTPWDTPSLREPTQREKADAAEEQEHRRPLRRRERERRADEAFYDGLLLGHYFWQERTDRHSVVEREPDTWNDDEDFDDFDDIHDMDGWD